MFLLVSWQQLKVNLVSTVEVEEMGSKELQLILFQHPELSFWRDMFPDSDNDYSVKWAVCQDSQ